TSAKKCANASPIYPMTPTDRTTLGARFSTSLSLYALLLPTFALLATFSLVPFVIAFLTSFYDYEVGGPPAKFVGLFNYKEYFHDYTFAVSFGHMLFLTGFAVFVVMIVPLIVAKLIFSLSAAR